jgi:hypothetical protein
MRRVTDEGCHQFVDQDGTLLARLDEGVLSIGPTSYKFNKVGLVDGAGGVILPWPKERSSNPWGTKLRYRISLPDGSQLEFRKHQDPWTSRWNVAEVVDSTEVLLTLRWRAEDLSRKVGPAALRRLKGVGEAVIAPGLRLPVDQVLLTSYGFQAFDRVCTWVTF